MKRLLWIIILLVISSAAIARSVYKIEGNNVIVDLEGIGLKSRILKVEIWSDNIVKIVSGMKVNFSSFESLIPNSKPQQGVKFKVSYAQNNIEIVTKEILISVQEDGLVRVFNRDGNKLLIESDRLFETSSSDDGEYKIKQKYFLAFHEHVYGFGQDDKEKRYNIRNKSFKHEQTVSKIASPIMFSEKGYALIWDNYSLTNFNDAKSGLEIASDVADEIQYFFVYGPEWGKVISEIRKLTGSVPMLPRWAFGHWLYPGNFSDENALNERIKLYESEGIPVEKKTTEDYNFIEEENNITENALLTNNRLGCALAYSQLKGRYADLLSTSINRRLCIPTHTNFPGIQRYGTFVIAGEIPTSWETLKSQVTAGINLSLSGQPYWSSNLGGSTPKNEIDLASFNELMVRWYQFSSLTPLFRGTKPDRDILSLKKDGSEYNAVLNAIKLRYHLLPYIYSSASDVVFEGRTFMRSLLFDYQKNEKVHDIDSQYLLGLNMMVCPITDSGIKQVKTYLPEGDDWFDFWSGKQFTGNTDILIETTIDNIPLFIKSGSIIPFATIGNNTSDSLKAPMELRIYPGKDASFSLYEDNNDGHEYLNNKFTNIKFDYSEKDKTLTIGNIEGSYEGMITERLFKVVIVSDKNGYGLKPSEICQDVYYKGKKIKIKLL